MVFTRKARVLLLDLGAELGKRSDRRGHESGDFGIDRRVAEIGRVDDAQVGDAALEAGAPVARLVG
jgi:hypothetical protein